MNKPNRHSFVTIEEYEEEMEKYEEALIERAEEEKLERMFNEE